MAEEEHAQASPASFVRKDGMRPAPKSKNRAHTGSIGRACRGHHLVIGAGRRFSTGLAL
jgi:hypothetical protein